MPFYNEINKGRAKFLSLNISKKIFKNTQSNKGVALVDSESLRDTLIDLHNYAAMGIMLLDENREKNY